MVINATINNISVRSWQSVLLVEETGVPRENHRPDAYTVKYKEFTTEYGKHSLIYIVFITNKNKK